LVTFSWAHADAVRSVKTITSECLIETIISIGQPVFGRKARAAGFLRLSQKVWRQYARAQMLSSKLFYIRAIDITLD